MHIVISKFCVANDMSEEVLTAFLKRPHLVDNEPGFISIQVLRPVDNPNEFWLITHWENFDSWEQWYHGHKYKQSHHAIPKGLKLDPSKTKIQHFDLIAS